MSKSCLESSSTCILCLSQFYAPNFLYLDLHVYARIYTKYFSFCNVVNNPQYEIALIVAITVNPAP